ncbi:hypothetical protein FB451DRAFT_1244623 [Mycena latifolia]|nr:hypothetical protein FB451DRAFT_1244623 [Mycena latifolia]
MPREGRSTNSPGRNLAYVKRAFLPLWAVGVCVCRASAEQACCRTCLPLCMQTKVPGWVRALSLRRREVGASGRGRDA